VVSAGECDPRGFLFGVYHNKQTNKGPQSKVFNTLILKAGLTNSQGQGLYQDSALMMAWSQVVPIFFFTLHELQFSTRNRQSKSVNPRTPNFEKQTANSARDWRQGGCHRQVLESRNGRLRERANIGLFVFLVDNGAFKTRVQGQIAGFKDLSVAALSVTGAVTRRKPPGEL
jgi:hypothetical protein